MLLLDDAGLCPHASHHWSCAHPLYKNLRNKGYKTPQLNTDFETMRYTAHVRKGQGPVSYWDSRGHNPASSRGSILTPNNHP